MPECLHVLYELTFQGLWWTSCLFWSRYFVCTYGIH